MKWVKVSDYAITCGPYNICRIGSASGEFFELWRSREHPDGPRCVATNIHDAKLARKLAQEDACRDES